MEKVAHIEWLSFNTNANTTKQRLLQIEGWGTNTHVSGRVYWRFLDDSSNTRYTDLSLIPLADAKLTVLDLSFYDMFGAPIEPEPDEFWGLELEIYTRV